MKKLTSTSEVIEALGGQEAVKTMFGLSDKAVNHWRYSRQFPAHTYMAMKVELAKGDYEAPPGLWRFTEIAVERGNVAEAAQ